MSFHEGIRDPYFMDELPAAGLSQVENKSVIVSLVSLSFRFLETLGMDRIPKDPYAPHLSFVGIPRAASHPFLPRARPVARSSKRTEAYIAFFAGSCSVNICQYLQGSPRHP